MARRRRSSASSTSPADRSSTLAENNRKTGSCPVLFTWNGERFVCLGDFLGGGGLGYLVAPGVYSQPDRDESVAIAGDQLRPVDGVFRLSITEPMDEVAYLDHLTLDVVDRPPGVSATPDERFAPEGPRPTGELHRLADADRAGPGHRPRRPRRDRDAPRTGTAAPPTPSEAARAGSATPRSTGSSSTSATGSAGSRPTDPLVLCLAGWVEYPYSQTNYAAATAGVALKPPAIERRRDDGTWEVIEPHAGYPAGLAPADDARPDRQADRPALRAADQDQHGMLLRPGVRRRARPRRRVLAPRDDARRSPAPRSGYRGYTREVSPDGASAAPLRLRLRRPAPRSPGSRAS